MTETMKKAPLPIIAKLLGYAAASVLGAMAEGAGPAMADSLEQLLSSNGFDLRVRQETGRQIHSGQPLPHPSRFIAQNGWPVDLGGEANGAWCHRIRDQGGNDVYAFGQMKSIA